MEIIDVEAIGLEANLEESFGFSQGWVDKRSATLVRIESESGSVGWGECWGPVAGNREIVNEFLAPEIVGRNPLDTKPIFDDLCERGLGAYHSVVPYTAISGMDIALWDLRGKELGEPVYNLLGGLHHRKVRPYATGHYFKPDVDLEEQFSLLGEEAAENAKTVDAVKVKIGLEALGYGPEQDIQLVKNIREAIGCDTNLLVDANYAYHPSTAKYVGRALENLDVFLFEEPVHPTDVQGYMHLRETLDLKIAGGECNDIDGLRRLIEAQAIDIAQPDVSTIGGLTAADQVSKIARAHGIPVIPHVWGTQIAIAASVHLIGGLPNTPWLEFDLTPNPLREELSGHTFSISGDGMISVPEAPGLGIEIEPAAIERFRIN